LNPIAHFTDPQKWFSLLLFQKAGGSNLRSRKRRPSKLGLTDVENLPIASTNRSTASTTFCASSLAPHT
jgi:hypothetical protein